VAQAISSSGEGGGKGAEGTRRTERPSPPSVGNSRSRLTRYRPADSERASSSTADVVSSGGGVRFRGKGETGGGNGPRTASCCTSSSSRRALLLVLDEHGDGPDGQITVCILNRHTGNVAQFDLPSAPRRRLTFCEDRALGA